MENTDDNRGRRESSQWGDHLKAQMTTYQPFPNTHWSRVRRAGLPDQAAQREALKTLLERYVPALRSFLRTFLRLTEHDANDMLQAFIAEQVLEYGLISRADESKGRFRSLLLTSLRHYQAITAALSALADAARANASAIPHEMLLLDLYRALWALDSLTGQTTSDDILNLIFSTFCIGK